MDVNAALTAARNALKGIDRGAEMTEELYEAFDAIDGWMSKGGFLPTEWQGARASRLSAYEREILASVDTNWRTETAQAYAAYIDPQDGLRFGPIRSRKANCFHNADGTHEDYWEIQPFPGAWVAVPAFRIVSVRKVI